MTRLAASLLNWYDAAKRGLPWRRTRDPYAIWVAEIILQQTRVEPAIPYYERFLRRFPNVQTLAAGNEHDVLKAWEGLGYYRRARFLHRAARLVVDERGGELPTTFAGWRQLPGIGEYTAAAIASIANGETVVALDGNLLRVGARLFAVTDLIDQDATKRDIRRRFQRHIPSTRPGDFNQALMDLGATICLPGTPDCPACPVRTFCQACRAGIEHELPCRRAKKAIPECDVCVGIIARRGRILVQRRPSEAMLGGLWEFPGGKREHGESLAACVARELEEELGMPPERAELVGDVHHAYSHFKVHLHAFACAMPPRFRLPRSAGTIRWLRPAEIAALPLPAGTRKLIAAVTSTLPFLANANRLSPGRQLSHRRGSDPAL